MSSLTLDPSPPSSSSRQPQSQPLPIPTRPTPGPPAPTGDLITDVTQSVTHITQVPCARNSLLSGIASGAGIGVVRGLSTGPLVAGHWAMATFTIISLASWHLCQWRISNERKKVAKIIESLPQRKLKQQDKPVRDQDRDQGTSPTATAA